MITTTQAILNISSVGNINVLVATVSPMNSNKGEKMRWLCKIGLHKWRVKWLVITGDAKCDRCGATGLATPDGIQDVQLKDGTP